MGKRSIDRLIPNPQKSFEIFNFNGIILTPYRRLL